MRLRILDGAKNVNEEEEIESVRFWIIPRPNYGGCLFVGEKYHSWIIMYASQLIICNRLLSFFMGGNCPCVAGLRSTIRLADKLV